MTTQRILFIDKAHPYLQEQLEAMGFQCDFHLTDTKEQLAAILPVYAGLVIRSRIDLDAAFLSHTKQLKFIARTGVGLEHIDLDYADKKGIAVFNSPEGSRDAVGEHSIGLLLCLMNNLSKADREVRAGQWRREPNRGVEIKGKTVGIIGYGNMGNAFAKRLQGFDTKRVIAYDKFKVDYGNAFAEAVSLEALQDESDIVSIHIPFMPENHHFINGLFLDRFVKPIYLVNTARGLVLHTADLVKRLKSGQVLGAALDVLEYEEGSFAHLNLDELPEPFQYLRQAPNVVLNPHIGGWSQEAKLGHAQVLVEKIRGMKLARNSS